VFIYCQDSEYSPAMIRAWYSEGQAKTFGDGVREPKTGEADYLSWSLYRQFH